MSRRSAGTQRGAIGQMSGQINGQLSGRIAGQNLRGTTGAGVRAIGLGALLVVGLGGCGSSSGGATYDVTAESATVDKRDDQGRCWESDCSAPRTYVCATLGGLRKCSTSRAATAPQWFEVLHAAAPSSQLLRSGLTVDYLHGSGVASDTVICHSSVVLTDLILGAGHFDLPCGGSNVVTLGLKAN